MIFVFESSSFNNECYKCVFLILCVCRERFSMHVRVWIRVCAWVRERESQCVSVSVFGCECVLVIIKTLDCIDSLLIIMIVCVCVCTCASDYCKYV